MADNERSRLDEILDVLADEVAARLAARALPDDAEAATAADAQAPVSRDVAEVLPVSDRVGPGDQPYVTPGLDAPGGHAADAVYPVAPEATAEEPEEPRLDEDAHPADHGAMPGTGQAASHTARLLGRLAVGLLVAIVLINIPFNRHGTALARAIPGSASLVIRNGLLVKEADKPDIYVYQDGKFRWISSLDAFEHYGYRWKDVHEVEAGYLARFEIGTPLHVLLKCPDSPHIYRLEGGVKRWIVDIATFEAEGHKWADVRTESCDYLRGIPTGETIPPGRGPAPQP